MAIAPRQQQKPGQGLTGLDRAALLMLALGQENAKLILEDFTDDEIKEISLAMSRLGPVEPSMIEETFVEFITRMTAAGALMGNFDATERLLKGFLPGDRVNQIMEEIRGPAGRNIWEKLSNVQEEVLANYLKNEYPQTVAVILSKIRAEHAARLLSVLPEDFSVDVVMRMLRMEAVQKEILERVEQTLRSEFMANLAQTSRRDAHEQMAEIFNSFDRQTETRFLTALEEENRDSAEKIKSLMFTFEDLSKLDAGSVQTLLRQVEKDKLAIALKGATDAMRDFFFANMSGRAAQIMRDDMGAMGPVRLKDVDEAQSLMVSIAKDMAARGEIMITKSRVEDELIY
jgi:flagellar motor switch protein FliG